jgi:hypothetical protein
MICNIQLGARLAFVQVPISHSSVLVEVKQRLDAVALEACFFSGLHAPQN